MILGKVKEKINKEDFNIYVYILEVLNRLRNKYMFHHNNYDTLSFMFKNSNELLEKDKLLSKFVTELIDDIKKLEKIKLSSNESQLVLLKLRKEFDIVYESLIKNIKRNDKKYTHCNYYFYEDFPKNASIFCFIFLLFIGKKDLDLV